MKKVMVIGCPGSGKSTFSRALQNKTGILLYHLDMMYWNADKTVVEREAFLKRLSAALDTEEWIIDGNYASTMELRLSKCDTVFFLDLPTDDCLEGMRARMGKPRSDMPWIETEEDAEFSEYIKKYREQERPKVMRLLDKFNEKSIIIFKSREEADEFLTEL